MGPWAVAFAFSTLSALLIFFLLRPDPMVIARSIAATETHEAEVEQIVRPVGTLLRLPKVQLAIVSAILFQSVMVILMVMTPLYMNHHNHGRENISLVIAMHTLGMYGLSALTGYLIDRFGRIAMLYVGAATVILSAVLSPLSVDQYILSLTLFLLGLGWNFGYVASSSLLADTLRGPERVRIQGINESLVFLFAGFGSLAAGPLFANGGYAAVSNAGIVLTIVYVGLVWLLGRPQIEPPLPA